jgi:hypothetical protein
MEHAGWRALITRAWETYFKSNNTSMAWYLAQATGDHAIQPTAVSRWRNDGDWPWEKNPQRVRDVVAALGLHRGSTLAALQMPTDAEQVAAVSALVFPQYLPGLPPRSSRPKWAESKQTVPDWPFDPEPRPRFAEKVSSDATQRLVALPQAVGGPPVQDAPDHPQTSRPKAPKPAEPPPGEAGRRYAVGGDDGVHVLVETVTADIAEYVGDEEEARRIVRLALHKAVTETATRAAQSHRDGQ